ncbi:DUF1284 domain-containing protein [Niallia alba]|uniref:DUF1284 domain-containing protein n=1 Tax=Niallia alba TaxID=2729105 RepID=UPI00033292A6|nr:hypothetical protein A499_14891 [Niallia nealsonii AAU1]MDU1845074.1 DUF1284 domain-containing protein [Niallia nealsonii]
MYKLRGHHLLCLLGYRGMGYSAEYIENMTHLHHTLRMEPNTIIHLVDEPDYLCEKYPNSGKYHCHDTHIYKRDALIMEKLALQVGQKVKWKDIEERVCQHIIPSDLAEICETCSWRSYGVCEIGIKDIHLGKGLREVK